MIFTREKYVHFQAFERGEEIKVCALSIEYVGILFVTSEVTIHSVHMFYIRIQYFYVKISPLH